LIHIVVKEVNQNINADNKLSMLEAKLAELEAKLQAKKANLAASFAPREYLRLAA